MRTQAPTGGNAAFRFLPSTFAGPEIPHKPTTVGNPCLALRQPRKLLFWEIRLNDHRSHIIAGHGADHIKDAQNRRGDGRHDQRELVSPRAQLSPRNTRPVVKTKPMRAERRSAIDCLPYLARSEAVDPIWNRRVAPTTAFEPITMHRSELVCLSNAELLSQARDEIVSRLEENNTLLGHTIHLE